MNLRSYLKKNGISNYKLSKKAQIGESTVSQFLNGKRDINLETACKIADALDITLDNLREMSKGGGNIEGVRSGNQKW